MLPTLIRVTQARCPAQLSSVCMPCRSPSFSSSRLSALWSDFTWEGLSLARWLRRLLSSSWASPLCTRVYVCPLGMQGPPPPLDIPCDGIVSITKLIVCLYEWVARTLACAHTPGVYDEAPVPITLHIAQMLCRTVEDLQLDISVFGAAIAAVSVVSSGLQQIFVRTLQQKHKLSSYELLSITAPAQAWTLFLTGPFVDKLVSGSWVFDYAMTNGALICLAGSCLLAVLVNISQFMCLGRFSAVSFQVGLIWEPVGFRCIQNKEETGSPWELQSTILGDTFSAKQKNSSFMHRYWVTPRPSWCCLAAGFSWETSFPQRSWLACLWQSPA